MPAMTIFIKTLDGRSMTFEVKPTETVDKLKALIEERQNIAPEMQRLLFGGKQLEDGKTLSDYNIGPDATGHLSEKMNMPSHDSGLTIAAQ
jgi:large subunit ribosomal protein L40e